MSKKDVKFRLQKHLLNQSIITKSKKVRKYIIMKLVNICNPLYLQNFNEVETLGLGSGG